MFPHSDLRPDLVIEGLNGPGKRTAIDISVTQPACDTYVSGAAQSARYAATEREKHKKAKYVELCERVGMDFVPFVFEVQGAIGKEGAEFIHNVIRHQVRNIGDAPDNALKMHKKWFIQRLQVQLQHGNARMIKYSGALELVDVDLPELPPDLIGQ